MKNGKQVCLILHNIRSAYNVGSIFRTADAAGVNKIYICGYSPTPLEHFQKGNVRANDFTSQNRFSRYDSKISKTALGAECFISWEYYRQTWRLMEKLKKEGVQVIALEQSKKSVDFRKFKPKFPIALVVGNEIRGLSKEILKRANKIIAIPMYGQKESLNVSVAAGIAIYRLMEGISAGGISPRRTFLR